MGWTNVTVSENAPGGPMVGGRYRLAEVIGYGGMAEVYRGVDERLGRTVAVKLLRASLASDTTFQARFRAEAQAAAGLNHPNVISVYDFGDGASSAGTIAGLPYIVMEFVEGRTLRDIVREDRRLLPERALEIVADILSALDYSHRMGIIHRDIKPANVMLTPSGDVKVMDFGIARAVADTSSSMTQTAAVIGTAQYLSPEQARGQSVDARSDLYSTGCVLYELLTGRPPFTAESPVALALAHIRDTAVPPDALDPAVPAAASAVTMMALAKDVTERYSSAGEMRDDVERALAGRPVRAPAAGPVGPVGPSPGQVRTAGAPRPPGRAGLVAGAVVGGAGGLAVGGAAGLAGAERGPGSPSAPAAESAGEQTGWSVLPAADPGGPPAAGRVAVARRPDLTGPVWDTGRRRRRRGPVAAAVTVVVLVLAGLAYAFHALAGGSSSPVLSASAGASTAPASRGAGSSTATPSPSTARPRPSSASATPSASASASTADVTVPSDLAGISLGVVEQRLRSLGLVFRTQGQSSSRQADTVLSTSPGPLSTIPRGGTVVVTYADGSTVVPDVRGLSVPAATAALQAQGFGVDPVRAAGTGDGTVSRTTPAGNVTATQGSTVTVFFKDGTSAAPVGTPTTAPAPTSASAAPTTPAPTTSAPHTTRAPGPTTATRLPSAPARPADAGLTAAPSGGSGGGDGSGGAGSGDGGSGDGGSGDGGSGNGSGNGSGGDGSGAAPGPDGGASTA